MMNFSVLAAINRLRRSYKASCIVPNSLFIVLILSLFVAGCDSLNSYYLPQKLPISIPPNLTNASNSTSLNSTITPDVDYSNGTYYFVSSHSAIITSNQTSIIIDAGDYYGAELLGKLNRKPDAVISTNGNADKTSKLAVTVLSLKPSGVFDNGIPDLNRENYLKYADRLGISHIRVIQNKEVLYNDMALQFFVPFQNSGFFSNPDWNSLVIQADGLLYMSNCYGDCEKQINTKANFIVLANNGHCPTNSIDFLISTFSEGTKAVIGDELCKDLADLTYFGVQFLSTNSTPVIIKEEK